MTASSNRTAQETKSPSLAAILTWFVPGMGHVYAGFPVFGLIAFLIVEGVYLIGLKLSHGMAFEFLQPDLRTGPMAIALTPEAANLGAIVLHYRSHGFGEPLPRTWPEYVNLGVWLTAISGLMNACLMVRAHGDAKSSGAVRTKGWSTASLVFMGWAVPGLGHFLQGRRVRALIVFALLCGTLVLGTVLAEGSNLDRERHFYYWSGQFLVGIPAMILEWTHGHARVAGEIPYVDAGLVFACLAGLLNVLALLDVYGRAESTSAAAPATRSSQPAI